MKCLESFEFIYCMTIISRSLIYLKETIVKIQGMEMDIVGGVSSAMECCETIRKNVDSFSQRIFDHSKQIAEASEITVSMPRISKHQQNQLNPEFTSIEDYYKKTVTILFLDHLVADITSRFNAHSKQAASLEKILQSKISENSFLTDLQEAIQFYSDDLPNSEILDEEFFQWKSKWLHVSKENQPVTSKDEMLL